VKKIVVFILIGLLYFPAVLYSTGDMKTKWLAKKPIVKQVEISGNSNLETDKIKEAISTNEQGFWQKLRLKSKVRLRKNSQRLDGAAIDYLYKKHGYLDVKHSFEYEVAEDSSAIVKIYIEEGQCYYINKVYLPYDLGRKKAQVENLTRVLKPGDVYNPFKIGAVASAIEGAYANQGYPYADIRFTPSPSLEDSTRLDIDYFINPGPLTIFGEIKIDSLNYTSSRVVKREMVFKPGDLYSRQKLINSRQRIYETSLFTYVDFKTDIQSDSIITDPLLTITATEKKPRFIRIKTGASQDTTYDLVWNLALELGNRNISGLGRSFRFSPSVDFQVISGWRLIDESFSFYYIEPWPFGLRMPLSLSFSWEPRLRRTERDFDSESFRIVIGVLKELGRFIKIRTGFQFESVNITGVAESDIDQLKRDEDISIGRSFWISFERDSRPNIFVPTSGSVIRLYWQFYGGFLGGDKQFHKIVGEFSRYLRISRWDIYAFRFKSGWEKSLDPDGFIPTTDLFFLGGANTIRGYREDAVGPKYTEGDQIGEPRGGKFYLITNHEWRRFVIGDFWMSLFVDIGNNWNSSSDFKFSNLLASAGIGVQYVSPLGPIRLDYGQRIAWKPVKPGGRFHISILYAF